MAVMIIIAELAHEEVFHVPLNTYIAARSISGPAAFST